MLGDGERVWREYHVMGFPTIRFLGWTLNRAQGTGTLYVTDARLLFYANLTQRRGRRSALIQETQLQHITGLQAFVSRSWSLLGFVTAAVVGLIGLAFLTGGEKGLGLVFIVLTVIGIFLLLQGLALRGTVALRVQSGASQSSPLGFGKLGDPHRGLVRSMLGPFAEILTVTSGPRDATDLLIALPGPDADRVIVELGALIADLQAKGNLARTHWRLNGA